MVYVVYYSAEPNTKMLNVVTRNAGTYNVYF